MSECFGNFFILNGELVSSERFSNSLVYEGDSVYEVLRMKNGLPFFFADHYERLEKSAKLQNRNILSGIRNLKAALNILTGKEPVAEVNLKIVFNYNNDIENWLLYYIEPAYPGQEEYRTGVKAILFHAERNNPGSKVINHRLRSEIYHRLIVEGAYEALLVNRENCITEGSRSNLFFIRENKLYTAPDDTVLNGITRKHLILICRESRINVIFRCINVAELSDFECALMTGTSPVVLPFSRIGDIPFKVDNPVIAFLRNTYLEKARASMALFTAG